MGFIVNNREKKKMNIYFDCEFTGLKQDTTLISIGLVSDDGKEFYAEFTDYDWESAYADKWILENVVDKLYYRTSGSDKIYIPNYYIGKRKDISTMLRNWLNQFDEVQLVSDVCHYDFVLFISLFGSAFDLPKNISPCCHDINQDIARYYGISEREAFDKSREEIVQEIAKLWDWDENMNKHNSLYDASVIRLIYRHIKVFNELPQFVEKGGME